MVFSIVLLGFLDNKGVLLLGFSPRFLHHVFWLDNRVFFQIVAVIAVVSQNQGVYSPFFGRGFEVGFSGAGGGTLESHCIAFLEVSYSVFNL